MNGEKFNSNNNYETEQDHTNRHKDKLIGFYLSAGNEDYIFRSNNPEYSSDQITPEVEGAVLEMMANGHDFSGIEKQLLSHIAGPDHFKGTNGIFEDDMADDKHQKRILAYMTGGAESFNKYNETNGNDVKDFLRNYPTPKDFEKDRNAFLSVILRNNGQEKADEYNEAMEVFQTSIYGKKYEYYKAMEELHSEADAIKNLKKWYESAKQRQPDASKDDLHKTIVSGLGYYLSVPGYRLGDEGYVNPTDRQQSRLEELYNIVISEKNITDTKQNNTTPEDTGRRSFEIFGSKEMIKDSCCLSLNKGNLIGQPDRKNEDSAYYDPSNALFGVFDGAGGERGAAQASSLSARTLNSFANYHQPENVNDLRNILIHTNEIISGSEEAGLSTAVLGKVVEKKDGKSLIWASVGDSRIYVARGEQLFQLTKDEGYENVITNAIGMGNRFRVEQAGEFKLQSNDRVVFCSDGITGDFEKDFIPENEFLDIINNANSSEEASRNLINRATKKDDRTALVFEV